MFFSAAGRICRNTESGFPWLSEENFANLSQNSHESYTLSIYDVSVNKRIDISFPLLKIRNPGADSFLSFFSHLRQFVYSS